MAINRITNSPILINSYNSRGLTTNNSVTKNCLMLTDGTLYAVVGDFSGKHYVMRSADNGFSWQVVIPDAEEDANHREVAAFNQDGLMSYIVIDERLRHLDLYLGAYESIGMKGTVLRARYDLDNLTAEDSGETAGAPLTQDTILTTTDDPFQGVFDLSYNKEEIFVVWVDGSGDLLVTRVSPRTTSVSADDSASESGCFNFLSSVCDDDGNVDIVYEDLVTTNRILYHRRYTSSDGNFTAAVQIENFGASPEIGKDIALARDGYGNLCVAYYSQNQEDVKYATSVDSGATWDVNTITATAGHSGMVDSITSDKVGRTNIIGGSNGGFIIAYSRNNGSRKRSYVRQLTTSDSGATYDLQEEKDVATKSPYDTEDIVGVQFFHPVENRLLDLSDPGKVRIAFTVGEGDSTIMSDTLPVTFGQELLSESAYPTSLSSESSSYSIDTADSISLLVRFATAAGPDSNIDYYAGGFKGTMTDRYLNAFEEIGNSCRLLKYEPKSDNFLNNINGYGPPTEYEVSVLFDPVTYSFPSPALNKDTLVERIEVDVRKLHIPPNFHPSRQFVVNKGGFLKRTVWLIEYDGNQYEISQVIPRFIMNQICFYECNAYVVGPSRDPFSRTVLTSET